MIYKLTWYYSGEEYTEELDSRSIENLLSYCIDLISDQTGDPDTSFDLKDAQDNIIFTEENLLR